LGLSKKQAIALLTIGIILSSILLARTWVESSPEFDIIIYRNFSNIDGRTAIQRAEELDLATMLDTTRYRSNNDPSTKPSAYVWPHIIDKEALDFYQNKINKLKNSNERVKVRFNYTAEVEQYSNLSVSYGNLMGRIQCNEQKDILGFSVFPSLDSTHDHGAIAVNSSMKVITLDNSPVKVNMIRGYLITQEFYYSETYGPLAGYGGGVEQVIVLDQDYLPVLVLSRTTRGWIS
jgi:hypothetical protein